MDEQFALLSIADALAHALNMYNMLLQDKMLGERGYIDKIGFNDVLLAHSKLLERVKEIEDSEIPDDKEL